jgi:hypothetical protein
MDLVVSRMESSWRPGRNWNQTWMDLAASVPKVVLSRTHRKTPAVVPLQEMAQEAIY